MKYPDPWYIVRHFSLEKFILSMLSFGCPIETLLVGAFKKEGRGAQRDMELDMHQDGIYSSALEKRQGTTYVENPNVDIVGMYCIRGNSNCSTIIEELGSGEISGVVLNSGEALILNNRRVLHGRKGPVGDRVLFRMWLQNN